MSMAWERTRRRYDLIHTVLAEVASTGRPHVSADLAEETATPVDVHHRDVLLTATGVDQSRLPANTRCARTRRVS